jgi:hypothetical protein
MPHEARLYRTPVNLPISHIRMVHAKLELYRAKSRVNELFRQLFRPLASVTGLRQTCEDLRQAMRAELGYLEVAPGSGPFFLLHLEAATEDDGTIFDVSKYPYLQANG